MVQQKKHTNKHEKHFSKRDVHRDGSARNHANYCRYIRTYMDGSVHATQGIGGLYTSNPIPTSFFLNGTSYLSFAVRSLETTLCW